MILCSLLALTPLAKAQLLLEALDAPLQEKFTVPQTWSMEVNNNAPRYLASVYDNNYLPMNANDLRTQPATASTTASAPDATNDPLLNYQGRIGSYSNNGALQRLDIDQAFEKRLYAVNVKFTPRAGSTEPINIPSTLAEAVIPARYLKNTNQDVRVSLKAWFGGDSNSWKPTTSTEVTAYIVADREVELIQLDMNQGIGQDGKGILLTIFDVAGAPLELRLLPGVPDKYAGKKTNSYVAQGANLYEHDMFYMPVNAPAGGTWLSYDLGAYTTNLKHPDFYPLAKDRLTHLSAGSLYQWGRDSDGHELRENPTSTNPKYGTTATISTGITPGHSQVITGKTPTYETWFDVDKMEEREKALWLSERKSYLWDMENSLHLPCPEGYNISKSNNLYRDRWRSDDNYTGTPWADSFHRDNNLYGINNGEYYNWVWTYNNFNRKGLRVFTRWDWESSSVEYDHYIFYNYDGEKHESYLIDYTGVNNTPYPNNAEIYSAVIESTTGRQNFLQAGGGIMKRHFFRESRPFNQGPILWLNTTKQYHYNDRAPVRCVKE